MALLLSTWTRRPAACRGIPPFPGMGWVLWHGARPSPDSAVPPAGASPRTPSLVALRSATQLEQPAGARGRAGAAPGVRQQRPPRELSCGPGAAAAWASSLWCLMQLAPLSWHTLHIKTFQDERSKGPGASGLGFLPLVSDAARSSLLAGNPPHQDVPRRRSRTSSAPPHPSSNDHPTGRVCRRRVPPLAQQQTEQQGSAPGAQESHRLRVQCSAASEGRQHRTAGEEGGIGGEHQASNRTAREAGRAAG
jgi:hypothetical protein